MMRSVRSEPSVAVGLIGLGRMGLPICRRLVQAGFSVRATDVRDSVRSELNATGARWKPTAAAVAADIDLLVTVLPGAVEVLDVTSEITDAMPPGAIWVEMSTASPRRPPTSPRQRDRAVFVYSTRPWPELPTTRRRDGSSRSSAAHQRIWRRRET